MSPIKAQPILPWLFTASNCAHTHVLIIHSYFIYCSVLHLYVICTYILYAHTYNVYIYTYIHKYTHKNMSYINLWVHSIINDSTHLCLYVLLVYVLPQVFIKPSQKHLLGPNNIRQSFCLHELCHKHPSLTVEANHHISWWCYFIFIWTVTVSSYCSRDSGKTTKCAMQHSSIN